MTTKGTSPSQIQLRSETPFWRDERVLRIIAQVVSTVLVIGFIIFLVINFFGAAEQRGLSLSYDFLSEAAGFPISESPIPYDPSFSFGYAFIVGILNTLKVTIVGIIVATILGTLVGLARLSSNWLLSRIALIYIEFHRNIPLLVLLFLWYFAVFQRLPPVKESAQWPGPIYLNQRGLYLTWPRLSSTGLIFLIFLFLGVGLAIIAWVVLRRLREVTGRPTYFGAVSLGLLILFPTIGWVISGGEPLVIDIPSLEGFNFQGGLRLTLEFTALFVGLTMYTAAFIAEVVRAGIQAVSRGQLEAAMAVGLNNMQVLGLVIIPQAMRVIIPPMISQYLNLAKNSSLAIAIGYLDLFFAGRTIINQAGRAVPVFSMIMASYLIISIITSIILNFYNRRIQFVER
ncbi:MAG: ABC transporter permease subunit [Anaerolineales bacterium]|jgi:general L-amino acid transport system permease protein